MNIMKKGIATATLVATAWVSTAMPAMARDHYRHHDNTAGVAIGVGILGLAVGAAVASNHHDRYRGDRYYDRGYRDDRYYDHARGYDDSHYYDSDRDWQRRGGDYDSRYYGRRGY